MIGKGFRLLKTYCFRTYVSFLWITCEIFKTELILLDSGTRSLPRSQGALRKKKLNARGNNFKWPGGKIMSFYVVKQNGGWEMANDGVSLKNRYQ